MSNSSISGVCPPERSPDSGRRLAERLEEEILQGTIELENSVIDYPTFSYRPKGWKTDLPLLNTSSMVTELAPVVLYLRHLVRPGDILIIEEPEAHLHPAAQAAFTKILVSCRALGCPSDPDNTQRMDT